MNLPPYISRTPPPLNDTEDDEDEEFGTFAVCSDLGEEVCDAFENSSNITRGDDNVSEDSGFCMNSVCQTQSPCDVSPLSSSYYKVNECMSIDTHGNIADSSPKETESSKSEDLKLNNSCYDHSSFTQEFETFQNDEIYVESSNQVDEPELSKNSFDNEISNSNSNVNGVETVNTVDNNATDIVTSTPVNENHNFSHIVNERNFQESLKTNEADWFNNSCEKVADDICSSIKHSKLTDKHFELQNESGSYIQNTANDLNYPEFTNTSYSEKSTDFFASGNANEENIDNVDNWGSEDDFSDFTSFQVVESDSEISHSKYEFQFGESEIVVEGGSELIYGELQSVIESNCLWNSLKCFEDTHAFKYQWSTSFTQMKFLQALHIDSRNILCGPWNKMNKINLPDTYCSFEISTHNVDAFSSSNSTRNKDMIPDAHFDWITSGLINPLQGTSNGKEIINNLEENNVTEILKSRSRDVLSSLPNLNFLKLTYISFK